MRGRTLEVENLGDRGWVTRDAHGNIADAFNSVLAVAEHLCAGHPENYPKGPKYGTRLRITLVKENINGSEE